MGKKRLRMHNSYEPNRLSKTYLFNAYEKLMPPIKQSINAVEKEKRELDDEPIQQLQGNVKW
jgi:hypothetical protein